MFHNTWINYACSSSKDLVREEQRVHLYTAIKTETSNNTVKKQKI